MSEHTAKAFDVDLQELNRCVAQMGGLVEKAIADSVDAMVRIDTTLAERVINVDQSIDNLQRDVEEKAILTIARRPHHLDGGVAGQHLFDDFSDVRRVIHDQHSNRSSHEALPT